MKIGSFITLEGGEGVGKSTQARFLGEALEALGLEVLLTREPGGTKGAEDIRTLLLDNAQDWTPEAESLLFAAARADHVAKSIRPALERGAWVICDRFLDSSRAYQGGEGAVSDTNIVALHAIGSGGLLPDKTLLLIGNEDEIQARLTARDGGDSDRIGGRSLEYHRKVAARFSTFAEQEPERFAKLDASGSPKDVHSRIMQAIAPLLGGEL